MNIPVIREQHKTGFVSTAERSGTFHVLLLVFKGYENIVVLIRQKKENNAERPPKPISIFLLVRRLPLKIKMPSIDAENNNMKNQMDLYWKKHVEIVFKDGRSFGLLFQAWRSICIILTILNLSESAMLVFDESFSPFLGIFL